MSDEHAAATVLLVQSIERAAAFYGVRLGFALIYPKLNPGVDLIVLCRSGEQLCFKQVGGKVQSVRIRLADSPPWDAHVRVPDAVALARDFAAHGVALAAPQPQLGQRGGFQISDPDGNILYFADEAGSDCGEFLAAGPASLQSSETPVAIAGPR